MQVGDVEAGVKLGDIKFSAVDLRVPARIRVDVNFELDAFRLHSAIDKSFGAVVGTAAHK